jgi:hypothetical protein
VVLLLPSKSLVEQGQDLRHIELHIFEVQVILTVFLHFQEIIKLEIKLEKTTGTTCSLSVR